MVFSLPLHSQNVSHYDLYFGHWWEGEGGVLSLATDIGPFLFWQIHAGSCSSIWKLFIKGSWHPCWCCWPVGPSLYITPTVAMKWSRCLWIINLLQNLQHSKLSNVYLNCSFYAFEYFRHTVLYWLPVQLKSFWQALVMWRMNVSSQNVEVDTFKFPYKMCGLLKNDCQLYYVMHNTRCGMWCIYNCKPIKVQLVHVKTNFSVLQSKSDR